jgi:hypothetical protein
MSPRTHQRRYRRAWLERQCGATYRQIITALSRCGRSLRTTSDRDVVQVVREQLRLERERHESERDAIMALVIEVGRSRRWIMATLAQLDLSARDRPVEALREARQRAEQRGRAARRRKRQPKRAIVQLGNEPAANTTLATAV